MEYALTRYNGLHKLHRDWMWQTSGKKRVPKADKSQSHSQLPLLEVPKNTYLHNHRVYPEDLAQIHTGSTFIPSASVSPSKPCLVDSVGCACLVFSYPLAPTILPPPFTGSTKCLAVFLLCVPTDCYLKPLLWSARHRSMSIAKYH